MENEDCLYYDEEDAMLDKSFPDTYVILDVSSVKDANVVNLLFV